MDRRLLLFLMIFCATITGCASLGERKPSASMHPVSGHHQLSLTAASGKYSSWHESDIQVFLLLDSKLVINKTFGAAEDAWRAATRVNLFGKGPSEARPSISLLFDIDRETGRTTASVVDNDHVLAEFKEKAELGATVAVRIGLGDKPNTARFQVGDEAFQGPLPFSVVEISISASGADASWDPVMLYQFQRDSKFRTDSTAP